MSDIDYHDSRPEWDDPSDLADADWPEYDGPDVAEIDDLENQLRRYLNPRTTAALDRWRSATLYVGLAQIVERLLVCAMQRLDPDRARDRTALLERTHPATLEARYGLPPDPQSRKLIAPAIDLDEADEAEEAEDDGFGDFDENADIKATP